MSQFRCPKCKKPHNSDAKFCFYCKTDLEKELLEFKEKQKKLESKKDITSQLLASQELQQKKQADKERMGSEGVISSVFCPKCGKQHESKEQYCSYCGENLSDIILQFKDKRLPIKLNHETSQGETKRYPSGSPLPEPGRIKEDPTKDKKAFWFLLDCLCSGLCEIFG